MIGDLLNFEYAVISVGIFLVIVFIVGYTSTTFFGERIWKKFDSLLLKAPLFGLVYKAFKDLTLALVGTENKFSEPVLVKMTNEQVYRIGFVTNKNADVLFHSEHAKAEGLYAVYLPLSFSIAGDIYLVPGNRLTPIKKKSKDVMQIIVSGGLIEIEE